MKNLFTYCEFGADLSDNHRDQLALSVASGASQSSKNYSEGVNNYIGSDKTDRKAALLTSKQQKTVADGKGDTQLQSAEDHTQQCSDTDESRAARQPQQPSISTLSKVM